MVAHVLLNGSFIDIVIVINFTLFYATLFNFEIWVQQALSFAPIMMLAKPVEPLQLERTICMVSGHRAPAWVARYGL